MKSKDEYSKEYYILRELFISEIVHASHLRDCKNMEDVWTEGDRYTKVLKNAFKVYFERVGDGE